MPWKKHTIHSTIYFILKPYKYSTVEYQIFNYEISSESFQDNSVFQENSVESERVNI
jgi:hypothetical protein